MSGARREERVEQNEFIHEGRITKPAEETIDREDIWRAPGNRLNLVGLLLPALAAVLVLAGAVMVGVLSSSAFASALRGLLNSTPANAAFWTLAGAVVIAAGLILFLVAYAYFRRTLERFRSIVEKYRIEGVATMQTVQKLGPGSGRR